SRCDHLQRLDTMFTRSCHAIKRNHSSEGPSSFLFFDCETLPRSSPRNPKCIEHKLGLGVAVHLRLERGEVTRRDEEVFRTADQFWRFAESKLSKHRPIYLFAHNALFDWRLVDGWSVVKG